jgi:alpha-beta hydrolase superfamily lysophospholipase
VPETHWTLSDADGICVYGTRWAPAEPKAVVQVAHGWAEHRRRYARLAAALVDRGYAVWADDHLGHGETGVEGGGLGDLGPRGMEGVTAALHLVTERITEEEPGLPVVLLGHSWGSFLAQRLVRDHGADYAALVLTGTTRREPGTARVPRLGSDGERYAWLSRDAAEVAAYAADPWCGFENLTVRPDDPRREYLEGGSDDSIPGGLPVLILNGGDDPVGGAEGGARLARAYREAGLADVTLRVYEGARHEVFNETNRDEVTAELLDWLDARVR